MFGLGLSTLSTVVNGLDFSPLASMIEERAARWARLIEENELRQKFDLPLVVRPATEIPAPYEAVAASMAAILAAERATSRVAEVRTEAPAA